MNRLWLCGWWLVTTAVATPLVAPTEDPWQVKLELARRQRHAQNFAHATQTLVTMLNEPLEQSRVRLTLLELAATAQEAGQLARAIQVLAQYQDRFPDDPAIPEILLRQGLLYRELGATGMALAKFYGVMTTTLNRKLDATGYYQRLVLQAQTEIAETHYRQGDHAQAIEFFERLLKLDAPELKREEVLVRLIRSLAAAGRWTDVRARADEFRHAGHDDPEVEFWHLRALAHTGQARAAVEAALRLLGRHDPGLWGRRAGNELANHLYQSGDFLNARVVYEALAEVDPAPQWRVPVLYQLGLTCERLGQPADAAAAYAAVAEHAKRLSPPVAPSLQSVLDLAAWRKNHLTWQSPTGPPAP
jgi:tetratricopeptide (TPR) repeat protein